MIDPVENSGESAVEVPNVELPADDGITGESTTHPQKPPEAKTEPDEVQDGSEEAPKKENGWKRQRTKLKEENQRLQAEIAKYQGAQAQPVINSEPKEADFENVLDYVKALTKYNADQGINAYKAEQEARQAEAERQKMIVAHEERQEEFIQEVPDYFEKVAAVVNSGLVTPEIENAVLASDMSEKVAYHLANHPSDLLIMQNLGNNKAALNQAIATIETYIENNSTAVRQTKAAAPINPVKSKASSPTKAPGEMTQQEIEAWRYGYRTK